jgi:chaperonin GroES
MLKEVRPLRDGVVILPDEPVLKTRGGLYLPGVKETLPKKGTIVAAGPGRFSTKTGELIPNPVKVGDKVIFNAYTTFEVRVDDVEYRGMISAEHLEAVIE